MQAKQLGDALRAFALLMKDAGATKSAAELGCLADALTSGGTDTVATIVSKVQRHWKASKRVPIYPATLKAQLEGIGSVLRVSGAKTPANDCVAVLKLFAGGSTAQAQAFSAEIAAAIEAPAPVAKPKSKPLDPGAIRSLADKLDSYRTDNAQFDVAIAELQSLSQLKKGDLEAIAHRFLGTERKFKSKPDIFKAMKNRQLQDAIQASRDRRIEKIAV
jgi:hypothetical protein